MFDANALISDYITRGKPYIELGEDGLVYESEEDNPHIDDDDVLQIKPIFSIHLSKIRCFLSRQRFLEHPLYTIHILLYTSGILMGVETFHSISNAIMN